MSRPNCCAAPRSPYHDHLDGGLRPATVWNWPPRRARTDGRDGDEGASVLRRRTRVRGAVPDTFSHTVSVSEEGTMLASTASSSRTSPPRGGVGGPRAPSRIREGLTTRRAVGRTDGLREADLVAAYGRRYRKQIVTAMRTPPSGR